MAGPLSSHLPESLAGLGHYLANLRGVSHQALAILGGVTLLFVVGLIDDFRPLGPRCKLLIQIIATVPLLATGVAIKGFLPLPLGWALTVFWIVLLTNSFNFLDNMDGLSASVALVICLVLALAAVQGGQLWMPALFLCLAGALGGFLFFNFHPATLFMGDSGSLVIGYLMGVFSILTTYYEQGVPSGLPVLMPLAIMGVPLFDTLSVMFIRWRAGKPLMVGDRNHFSHRLLAMGFGVRGAAVTIALLTGACGLLALPLRRLTPRGGGDPPGGAGDAFLGHRGDGADWPPPGARAEVAPKREKHPASATCWPWAALQNQEGVPMSKHGFTLIETLVSLAIVAILCSIGFVYYQGAVDGSDLKVAIPGIVSTLDGLRSQAIDKKAVIVVEFVEGEPRIQYTVKAEGAEPTAGESNFKSAGILKRPAAFREYRWPDGSNKPRTFTFFPNGNSQVGRVEFGTAYASRSIYLIGDRPYGDD